MIHLRPLPPLKYQQLDSHLQAQNRRKALPSTKEKKEGGDSYNIASARLSNHLIAICGMKHFFDIWRLVINMKINYYVFRTRNSILTIPFPVKYWVFARVKYLFSVD